MASEPRAWLNSCLLMCSRCVLHYTNHPSGRGLKQAMIPKAAGALQHLQRGLPNGGFWGPVVLHGSMSGGKTSTAASPQAWFPLGNPGHLGPPGVPTVSWLLPTVSLLTLYFCVWSQCLLLFIFRYNLRSVKCRHLDDFLRVYTTMQPHSNLEHSGIPNCFLVPSPKQYLPKGNYYSSLCHHGLV